VRATVHGITPYISTGAVQIAAVMKLLDGETNKVGFASACKAFGHRYLLGFLEQRGLARATSPLSEQAVMASSTSLTAAGASTPLGAAYIQDDRRYSFDEVGELSCRIANGLLALGLPRETKGAVWAANDVMAWTCTLGLWRANMCWIPSGARKPGGGESPRTRRLRLRSAVLPEGVRSPSSRSCVRGCRRSGFGSASTPSCRGSPVRNR